MINYDSVLSVEFSPFHPFSHFHCMLLDNETVALPRKFSFVSETLRS